MTEIPKNRRPFPWKRYILLAIVVLIAVWCLSYVFPRRNWSLKNVNQAAISLRNVPRANISLEGVRNVILVSIDTLRADHLSCYGYSRKTSPNIDAVAEGGILFNHAIAPVPITLPSHSSMLTGTTPPYHKVRDNNTYRLAGSNVTLAEILKENGFATAAFIGAFVLDSQLGLDQGFDTYDDDLGEKKDKTSVFYNERKASEVTQRANQWLDENSDQRFFLFLHYFDVHAPYEKHRFLTPPLTKSHYDSEITYTDLHIGKVIEKLKKLNLYDSTLLIITADHGEGLKDHSEKTHSFLIYHATVHVPLVMKVPNGPKGIVINDVVGLVDIVPTVCGFLDIDAPAVVQGEDLSGYFLSEKPKEKEKDRFLYCESLISTKFDLGPLLGMVGNRYKYIHSSKPQLYDLTEDPLEIKNLADEHPDKCRAMQDRIKLALEHGGIKAIADSTAILDDQTRARLESLGYIASGTVDENIKFGKIKLDPDELTQICGYVQKATTFKAEKKYGKSKKVYLKMLENWPDMQWAIFELGKLAVLEQDDEAILTYFSKCLENEDAEPDDANVMQIKPSYITAHINIGTVLVKQGKIEQAIKHYNKALVYNPYNVKTNFGLAGAYKKQSKLTEAIKYCKETLKLNPNMPQAHIMMGLILFEQGRFGKAVAHLNQAIKLNPDSKEAKDILTQTLAQKKRVEDTIVRWLEDLKRKPNQPELHHKMAVYFNRQDDFEKAIYYWNAALQLKPNWPDVLSRLARVKASYPDAGFYEPDEALKLAARACELTDYKNAILLDSLAIAYAATGQFDEAVKTAENALALSFSVKWSKSATQIEERLKLFRAKQPYRQQ